MTMDGLWAQIGGVLSLWLGVNIALIFELVELVYLIFTRNCRNSNKITQASLSNVQ
jgi:hypothetical protein